MKKKIRRFCRTLSFIICLQTVVFSLGIYAADRDTIVTDQNEVSLLKAIDDIATGNFDPAQSTLERLISEQPLFGLAQLVYADLLYTQARNLGAFGGGLNEAFISEEKANHWLDDYIEEARRRVGHLQEDIANSLNSWPADIIKVADSQVHLILVDGSRSRLHLLNNVGEDLQIKADFYTSVARNGLEKQQEGDKRTPLGVYFTTARLDQKGLGALYGSGAMPLNYPNALDRMRGRTGHGIWLHGVPFETYNRAPFATNGCLALPNNHFTYLADTLDRQATPVLIVDRIERITHQERIKRERKFITVLNRWNEAWNEGEVNSISEYYSPEFRTEEANYELFKQRLPEQVKQRQNQQYSDLSIFRYPNEEGLVVMSFKVHTGAPMAENDGVKLRQYWQKNNSGGWQIVYESTDTLLPIHSKGIPAGVKRIIKS